MKKTEKMIVIACIVAVSFLAFLTGKNMYDSKAHTDRFEMKIDDVRAECTQGEVIYLAELKNFKAGDYSWKFDYDIENDAVIKVYSVAGYNLETDSIPVFLEEQIYAGKGTFENVFSLNDDYQAMTFTIDTEGEISVTRGKVTGDEHYFADRKISYALFVACVAFFALGSTYIVLHRKNRSDSYASLAVFWGLILLCVTAGYIYIFTGYSSFGHDTKFHMYRIKAIAESLLNGNIPNRINGASSFGYGYANPLLYPELFLYIPAVWMNWGMSELGSVKLFYILLNFAAVFISYYSFNKICNNKFISFSVTAIYNLSFYKLLNIYVRGAMGEVLFMTFLPLTVYALYTFFYEEKPRWFLLAISVCAILQSHILGTAMACGLLGLFFVVFFFDTLIKKSFRIRIITDLIKSVLWVLLANIWFIVPFINTYFTYELNMFNKEEMTSWFFRELLSAEDFLSRTINSGPKEVFSAVGLMVLAGICVAAIFAVASLIKVKKDRIIILATAVITVFFGIICTDIPDWQQIMTNDIIKSILTTLQFSFRFEALFIMSLCFLIVFAAKGFNGKNTKKMSALIMMLVLLCVVPNMKEFADKAAYCRTDLTYRSFGSDQPPEYLKPEADIFQVILLDKKLTTSDNISITGYNKDGINIDFSVETDGNKGWVQLPLFYYDDYYATGEKGQRLNVYSGDKALLYVEIPENMGSQTVSVRFGGMMYDVCLYISLAFLLVCSAVWGVNLYRKKEKTE